jgi:hypothetical protein
MVMIYMDKFKDYFNCKDSERAAFEAGIKMGTIFHQFIGTPVSIKNAELLERSIENSIMIQPFVSKCSVKINRKGLGEKKDQYDYISLRGEMLEVQINISYNKVEVEAGMTYSEEYNYPIMFIKRIQEMESSA